MERFKEAMDIFRSRGGILRMSEAVQAGISRKTLYTMHDQGVLERLSRGVYRLASLPGLEAPDLVAVATRVPNGVVCLISALAFHELTTQVPHAIDVAIPRGAEKPRIDYPPINVYWFSGEAFAAGIETPTVDGRTIRVYSAEKSVADAFKYRNKIGMDVALEALRTWRGQRRANAERLLEYARTCPSRTRRTSLPRGRGMTKNVAASVRARLAQQAKTSNRPFQEVLQYYGLERFLYRFSRSQHRDRFLLKGALMLRVWEGARVAADPRHRSSRLRRQRDRNTRGHHTGDLRCRGGRRRLAFRRGHRDRRADQGGR